MRISDWSSDVCSSDLRLLAFSELCLIHLKQKRLMLDQCLEIAQHGVISFQAGRVLARVFPSRLKSAFPGLVRSKWFLRLRSLSRYGQLLFLYTHGSFQYRAGS